MLFPYNKIYQHVVLHLLFMPPTLKKLMGHIAFGACVHTCVGHIFCTYCNFYTVKARVLKFHISIPHKKIANLYFFLFRVISHFGVMAL